MTQFLSSAYFALIHHAFHVHGNLGVRSGDRGGQFCWPPRPIHLSGNYSFRYSITCRLRTPCTHCTRGWVGLRAGLDTEFRGKILCLWRRSNLDSPVVQSVARHYTDWATRLTHIVTIQLKTGKHVPVSTSLPYSKRTFGFLLCHLVMNMTYETSSTSVTSLLMREATTNDATLHNTLW
jgi:hypothetical protein